MADISRIQRDENEALQGFQRPEIKAHVKSIIEYLDQKNVIFPNAVILAISPEVKFGPSRGPRPDGLSEIAQSGTLTIPIYKEGETIYVEKPIYVDVPNDVDTGEILKDYFAKYTYKDTIKLEDSLGTVQITDTIQKNKIVSRTFKSNINQVHVRDSIIVKELPKTQLYVGGNIGVDKVVGFNYFGPTFVLKTKLDNMYSLGVGINNNKTTSIMTGVYWKIKLKK